MNVHSPDDQRRYRIGVNVGGTFTDLVLADSASGNLVFYKEPSTPEEPSEAVEKGVLGIMDRAGIRPESVELIVHGTTLGLNTIIQRKGASLALVVSKGNRDLFEIARGQMNNSFEFTAGREKSLVPRHKVFEVPARVLIDGTIESFPTEAEIDVLIGKLKRSGAASVAVTLLNSYLHPQAERDLATAIRAKLPGVLVTESAQIWPEIREYERGLVATLNAYIHPQINAYLTRLEQRLASIGVAAPIYITANNGGTLGLQTAKDRPIDTVLSGPASGVVASARLADLSSTGLVITFDMGGTSSDMAVSIAGTPEYTTRTTVGDLPLMLPVVNVSAIGAGGGSIIWVDNQGVLKVGPLSAGASPGPISYRRGGTQPAVTDCYVSMGILRPDGFLGGRMSLDRDAAVAALDKVAASIGIQGVDAAAKAGEAALRIASAKMATELFKTFAQRGLDPREFTLIAFGGAGPTQANLLAEEIGLKAILIPASPGTLCALGALVADLKRDYVRTVRRHLSKDSSEIAVHIVKAGKEIVEEARAWLAEEGDVVGPVTMNWRCDARYAGEGGEMEVVVPAEAIEDGQVGLIAEVVHKEHEAIYGFREEGATIEIASIRCQVTGEMPTIDMPVLAARDTAPEPVGTRKVFCGGKWVEATVYRRQDITAGDILAGPALVEQEDTTVWILPGWHGRVTDRGLIIITKA